MFENYCAVHTRRLHVATMFPKTAATTIKVLKNITITFAFPTPSARTRQKKKKQKKPKH